MQAITDEIKEDICENAETEFGIILTMDQVDQLLQASSEYKNSVQRWGVYEKDSTKKLGDALAAYLLDDNSVSLNNITPNVMARVCEAATSRSVQLVEGAWE